MQLEYLCDLELQYQEDSLYGTWVMIRPYGSEEGRAFGQGDGTVTGERLQGKMRWVNHPRRRGDGVMLPDVYGVIITDDGGKVLFSLWGRTIFEDGVGKQLLSIVFEAEDERYRWLNTSWCVLEGVITAATGMLFAASALLMALSALGILCWGQAPPENKGARGRFGDIFRNLHFWRVTLLASAMLGVLFGYQGLWAAPYLREALGIAGLSKGNLLLMASTGVVLGFVSAGWLADRFGIARVAVSSAAIFTLAQGFLGLFPAGWPLWTLGLLFAGFGVCGAFVVLYAQVRTLFPEHMTGRAVATLNLFAEGGAACVQWGVGLLIGLFLVSGAGHYPPEAYRAAFLATAVLSLLALLFYLPMLGADARGKR